jgi:hypothetical protein
MSATEGAAPASLAPRRRDAGSGAKPSALGRASHAGGGTSASGGEAISELSEDFSIERFDEDDLGMSPDDGDLRL